MSELIEIDSITIDAALQTRFSLNASAIEDYQAAIEASQPMPPVTIFSDGRYMYLADGFHRLQAYKQAGRDHIPADIRIGSRRDAFKFALSANATHGLRRSPEDKRQAVKMALDDLELNELSDRELEKGLWRLTHVCCCCSSFNQRTFIQTTFAEQETSNLF